MSMTPEQIVANFPVTGLQSVAPAGNGRMHATYLVETSNGPFILQRLGEAIPSSVMEDISKVTEHLTAHGILTQKVIRASTGAAIFEDGASRWRLMTYIPGTVIERDPTQEQARSAAGFLARFHAALQDYQAPFSQSLPQILNPEHAFSELERVLTEYAGTEKDAQCRELAQTIKGALPTSNAPKTKRVLHGDPKLANFVFDEAGTAAIALIDLDTLGRYLLPLELGDMLRSFCTKKAGTSISFDSAVWHATLKGYEENDAFMADEERLGISDGFQTVTLALAARYLADAYEEKYFAHDPSYATLFEQNLSRARMNLALVEDFKAKTEDGELAAN